MTDWPFPLADCPSTLHLLLQARGPAAAAGGGGGPGVSHAARRLLAGADCGQEGRTQCLRALLEANADANSSNDAGGRSGSEVLTPLFLAAQDGVASVALLLEHGADPNCSCTANGARPLLVAALQGNSAAMQLLLAAGARARAIYRPACY